MKFMFRGIGARYRCRPARIRRTGLRTKCEGRVRRGRRLFRQTGAPVVPFPQGAPATASRGFIGQKLTEA